MHFVSLFCPSFNFALTIVMLKEQNVKQKVHIVLNKTQEKNGQNSKNSHSQVLLQNRFS